MTTVYLHKVHYIAVYFLQFNALTLMTGCQECHMACKIPLQKSPGITEDLRVTHTNLKAGLRC